MIVRWLVKAVAGIVFLGALGFALWTWGSLKYVYSSGERAGYIQKFSNKGWMFKTWEGELAMVNLPGAMPEKFFFTVRDPHVAEQIQKTMGRRVVIHYNEHRGIPTNVFGDTRYFASGVDTVMNADVPASLPTALPAASTAALPASK